MRRGRRKEEKKGKEKRKQQQKQEGDSRGIKSLSFVCSKIARSMVILDRDFRVRKRKEDDAMNEPPSSDLAYRSPIFAVLANDGRILFVALRCVAFVLFCFVLLSSLFCLRIGHIPFCSYGVAKESIAPRSKCRVVGRYDFSSSTLVLLSLGGVRN